MDRMTTTRPRVQGRREMAMMSKPHGSLQKAPEHRVQRTMSQHTKCVRRNVQQITRSLSSERMPSSVQEISEEVHIGVTSMAEEYCYVETRHRQEVCVSPVEYSCDPQVTFAEGRSRSTKGEGHTSRPRVLGRRQMRELKALHSQSQWECESVDSGHCSEFSSKSSLSSAASTHSGCSHDSSFSEDELFVCEDQKDSGVVANTEYATVTDTPVKKLDNTYASIHSICDTPPVVAPPELPPRNRRANKCLGFPSDSTTKPCKNVIVKSKYHKYTVDDIVDSYMSLVNDIPLPASGLRRCHSDHLNKQPAVESPLRRTKSEQMKPCLNTVTKATSSFAVKYNVSVDCNEIFF